MLFKESQWFNFDVSDPTHKLSIGDEFFKGQFILRLFKDQKLFDE